MAVDLYPSHRLHSLSSQQLRSNGSFTGNSPSRRASSSVEHSFSQRSNGSFADGYSPSRRSSSHFEHSLSQRSNGSLVEHSPSQNLNTCVLDESYCIPQRRQEPHCESGKSNFSTSMSTNLSEESVDYIEPTQL